MQEGKLRKIQEEREDRLMFRMVGGDEEKMKVDKVDVGTRNPDTLRYIERKMVDKGVHRLERHPVDGLGLGIPPHKSGHGGKFTWEGPGGIVESQLDAAPAAIDERDPNYVDDDGNNYGEEEGGVDGVVVGEVEVPKAVEAKEGVSKVEIRPPLQV